MRAVRHLGPLRAAEQQLQLREPAAFCIGPDLAEALILAGDLEAAREVQEELEARGRELGRAWAIATALRCRGLIAATEGRPDDALVDLQEALAVHDDVPQPFDRARTLLALGTVQRRAKQRAEARRRSSPRWRCSRSSAQRCGPSGRGRRSPGSVAAARATATS